MIQKLYFIIPILVLLVIIVSSLFYFFTAPQRNITLKSSTILDIKRSVQRIPNFIGLRIVSADIQANTRETIYTYIVAESVSRIMSDYVQYRSVTNSQSLFDYDDDKINQRIVRLINHQFDCSPWNELLSSKFIPEIGTRIIAACALAYPPSYGEFDGFITIYLRKSPTDGEKVLINTILKDISNTVSLELIKGP